MTTASKLRPPAPLLLRCISDPSITASATAFLKQQGITPDESSPQTLITLAYHHGWRETA